MPIAEIQAPDGSVFEIEYPEGATDDQILGFVSSQSGGFSEQPTEPQGMGEQRRRARRRVAFEPQAQQEGDVSALGALGRGVAQGATLGTADEIAAAASGAYGALTGDESFSDIYGREQQEWQDILDKDIQQQPVASIGGQIIGGLAGGGGIGATRAGANIARGIAQGSRLARTGKAAALGAGVGAVEGAASSAQGERSMGAVLGGATGGILTGGMQGTSELYDIYKGGKGAVKSTDVKELANQAYRKSEELGGAFDASVTNKMLDDMVSAVPTDEFDKALGGAKVSDFVQGISDTLRDQPITLERADKINKRINRLMNEAPYFQNNRITEDGKDLLRIKEIVENTIDEAPNTSIIGAETRESIDALKEGRKLWGKSRRLGEVEGLIRKAMTKEQPAKSLMTAFTNLLENPKKIKGFTTEEKKAIKIASQSGALNDVVRLFGSRLVPIITGSTGADLGAVVGATAGSGLSRSLGANIQADKARDVLDVISGTRKAVNEPITEFLDPKVSGAVIGGGAQAIEASRDYITSDDPNRLNLKVRASEYRERNKEYDDKIDSFFQDSQQKTQEPQDYESQIDSFFNNDEQSSIKKQKSNNFDNVMQDIFKEEGGYVANDAGAGETNFGINKRANPDVDIKNLTKDKAAKIYKKRYWDKIKGDDLSPAMQVIAMDAAVNQGVGWTRNALRKAKGDVNKFAELRKTRYKNIAKTPSKKKYLNAWLSRVDRAHENALQYI